MADNKINGIKSKDAETKEERFLLGLIAKEGEGINHGQVILEISFRGGKLDRALFRAKDNSYKLHKNT